MGGFAAKVENRFDWYYAKRGPHGADHAAWASATAGIRRQIRDEIVSIYREQRVSMEQINWLIRHEVEQLASQWSRGALNEPADDPSRQPTATIVRLAAVACAALGSVITTVSLMCVDTGPGALALLVLAGSGYLAERKWTGFAVERRREAADVAESKRKFEEREDAYVKWMAKLADNKPHDDEMATWLEHDKKVILDLTLKHYGLQRSQVISYAFLETPGKAYKRASVRNGPWRYSQYRMLVFLLTEDGIRQAAFELRTRDGDIQPQDRHSYRYEAIASVQTSVPRDDDQQTFDLHLVNGKTINFRVAEPFVPSLSDHTDPDVLSKATQDATGLWNTLRILEGVAADGKEWIARESQLQGASE